MKSWYWLVAQPLQAVHEALTQAGKAVPPGDFSERTLKVKDAGARVGYNSPIMGQLSRQPGKIIRVGTLTPMNPIKKYPREIGIKIAVFTYLRLALPAPGPGEVHAKISA